MADVDCSNGQLTILLTGSTGSLGTYLLDCLLVNSRVSKVICLNTSSNAQQSQETSFAARGLGSVTDLSVHFLRAELSEKYLGLDLSDYNTLLRTVTTVLHNGWPVDFNRSFASFQSAVEGVVNLANFAHACHSRCSIFFVSSVGIVQNWPNVRDNKTSVPEVPYKDWKLARGGYGQSKMVAERILTEAAKVSKVPVSLCRISQIAGPVLRGVKGFWNAREWLPTLIMTSQRLKMIPSTLGIMDSIDWIPVDITANIVIELLLASEESKIKPAMTGSAMLNVYHITNPKHTSWATVLPVVQKYLGSDVSIVSPNEWLRNLGEKVGSPDESFLLGTKLLDFYFALEGSPKLSLRLDTKESQKASKTLASMTAVKPEWMDLWMRQWKDNGFLMP